jgi:hypothetical protein
VALMPYAEQWAALATRIKSLQSAGQLYGLFQTYQKEDSYAAGAFLREQCEAVVGELRRFHADFAGSLPREAADRLGRFFNERVGQAASDAAEAQRAARAALVGLVGIESEITFILAGRQEHIRARSELALLHLQQCLAVDEDLAAKWQKAYAKDEPACERLGAIQLLWHEIFAFKVNAEGARTDLVFNEPVETSPRGVEGLVLTEWKVADDEKAAVEKLREARVQADLYREGALAGVELRGYRYLIIVSQKRLFLPKDVVLEHAVYRHINIPIQPEVPSKAAPKIARTSKRSASA